MKKILLASLALSSVAATSAMAAPAHQRAQTNQQAITANTVVSEGMILGTDPDAYVRFELRRQGDPTNGNG